jgi:phosphotransferase family enzyme
VAVRSRPAPRPRSAGRAGGRRPAARPSPPRGPLHGDFYRRNILVAGDRLTLLDWDEARFDALVTELAWSVWEFGKASGGDALDEARAVEFLAAYEGAGGPPYPRNMIVPLIRANLRAELERGGPHEPAYDAAERRAFAALRTLPRGLA